MSRQANVNDSAAVIPSGYTGNSNLTAGTGNYVPANGYHDHTWSTNYARWTLGSSNTSTVCYVYYTFDTSAVPSDATITSVTATVKAYRNNRVTQSTAGVQLYANTTAKGSAVAGTLGTSATTVDITNGGSWTRSELNNLRLRLYGVRSSTSNTGYLYFYGATVTINYTVSGTEYEVAISNNVSGVTTIPSTTQYVFQGKTQEILISGIQDLSTVTITDNNNDIKSSLTYSTSIQNTTDFIPNQLYGSSGTTSNTNNGLGDTSSTTYAQLRLQSGTYLAYSFDVSSIPSNATISSVSCKVKGCVTRTSSAATVRLYNGTTAMGSTVNLATNSTATVTDLNCGTWTRSQLNNVNVRVDSTYTSNSTYYAYFYGSELTITYSVSGQFYTYTVSNISADHTIAINNAGPVSVTGITVYPTTASIDVGDTLQLTPTIVPSNATDKTVSWNSNHTNIATVSNGLVTGVSVGTATITVTTTDGNYSATCSVTVTQPVLVQYKLATSLVGGKSYLIVNTNNGSGYAVSNESGGSRTLKGVAVNVANNKVYVKESVVNNITFTYTLETANDPDSGFLMNGSNYLYTDSGSGLRMYDTTPTSNKHWHYVDSQNILWQFKDSNGTNGYEDTSSEYKYYLEWDASGNFTDNHLTSPSIADTQDLPKIYLFVQDDTPDQVIYLKVNGSWVQYSKIYKKINNSWVEQTDLSNLFDQNTIYIKV